MVVVGDHQILLALGQRLRDASPKFVLPDQSLIFAPFMEVLVADTHPLLVLAALPRTEQSTVLWIEVCFVNCYPPSILAIQSKGVVEQQEG